MPACSPQTGPVVPGTRPAPPALNDRGPAALAQSRHPPPHPHLPGHSPAVHCCPNGAHSRPPPPRHCCSAESAQSGDPALGNFFGACGHWRSWGRPAGSGRSRCLRCCLNIAARPGGERAQCRPVLKVFEFVKIF